MEIIIRSSSSKKQAGIKGYGGKLQNHGFRNCGYAWGLGIKVENQSAKATYGNQKIKT